MTIELHRDDRICLYTTGGVLGRSLVKADISLDKLPDDAFETVKKIIDALPPISKTEDDKRISCGMDFCIGIGKKDCVFEDLKDVFNSAAPSHTFTSLENILKPYQSGPGFRFKP